MFLHGSFFDLPIEADLFDCSISLHTIYHMEKDRQEEAVRKLINVTKAGKPIIIVYSNPRSFVCRAMSSFPLPFLRNIRRKIKASKGDPIQDKDLQFYFYAHPIEWWNRFRDTCTVTILPWRSFDSAIQKLLIPDNFIGKKMFALLFKLENQFPEFFVRHFQYPMIIMIKDGIQSVRAAD